MTDTPKKVVTRFAPSPTGFVHIGNVHTALFAFLWARKNNGTFILRIEDTDRKRFVEGAMEHMMESLRWLGIEWDFGPDKESPFGSCIQSERLDTYLPFAKQLIEKGLAYPDPYTPEQVDEFRKQAQEAKKPFLFREHRPDTFETWDGTKPLRYKVPEIKRMAWHDEVRGDLEAGEEALDDFVIIKADGYPTYNFAHIIDDHLMGVTCIMRGQEFISSMPNYLSMYEALGFERPTFITLPPILREDRTKKLGKRDGAKDFLDYRTDGFLPEAMTNFLAFIGWHPEGDRELFDLSELITTFDIRHIQKAGAVLNEDKLLWFNKEYLARLDNEQFLSYVREVLPTEFSSSPETLGKLVPILRERTDVRVELAKEFEAGEYAWSYHDPMLDISKVSFKDTAREITMKHLAHAVEAFTSAPDETFSSVEGIKSVLWDYATEAGRGAVLWPLRYALTGKEKSPDPFTVAFVIGKEAAIRRIQSTLSQL